MIAFPLCDGGVGGYGLDQSPDPVPVTEMSLSFPFEFPPVNALACQALVPHHE
jgi:hypothetical protein